MLTNQPVQTAALGIVCTVVFVAAMLALLAFDLLGPATNWVVLAIAFGAMAWGIRRKLTSRDEVLSEAFKMSMVLGAPTAIVLAILVTASAARLEGLRELLLYSWPETTNDPRMVGFGLGVAFTAILFSLCTALARAGWWIAKR